jgi:hypothetical protein
MTQITAKYFEGKEEWELTKSDPFADETRRLTINDEIFITASIKEEGNVIVEINLIDFIQMAYHELNCTTTEELEEKIEHAKQLFN